MNDQAGATATSRVSAWSARHRWWVIGAAVALIFLAGLVSTWVETVLLDDAGGEGEAAVGASLLDGLRGRR
jgi:hypothetical protein